MVFLYLLLRFLATISILVWFPLKVNVFEDSESVGSFEMDIDEFVEKYNITHIILSNQSQLNKVLKKIEGTKYKLVKEDENFSFYKIENL